VGSRVRDFHTSANGTITYLSLPPHRVRGGHDRSPQSMPGTLFVVSPPIGNLEDITARALRVLQEVAIVAAEDTRRTAGLFARHAISTPTTSLHEHNERGKADALVARLQGGEDVALVSDAGTPTMSDPGAVVIRKAIDAGIRVVPVPGPNAALATLAASGLPSDTFTFLGFPPTRSRERTVWLERLKSAAGTVVFFEAPHRIRETLAQIRLVVGEVPVVLGRELTKVHEEFLRGPISGVLSLLTRPIGEFTVVIDVRQAAGAEVGELAADATLLDEFGELTAASGMNRRQAVNVLARRHRRAPNDIYAAIERAKHTEH
jgi:16S rRNA (cytidine1402-2'-O)-methyltransferase